jgi:hypothetical protein
MHISVVSIEGDHLAEVGEVFKKCNYVIENTFTVATGKQASRELGSELGSHRVVKLAYVAKGWTFIVETELVLFTDDVWLGYSRKWKTRVMGWLCEGTSGSYGFTLYQAGKMRRQVFSVDGDISVEEGEPVPEEDGVDWNEASEGEVLGIAERLGAKYDFPANRKYTVFHLDESQMVIPVPAKSNSKPKKVKKKPEKKDEEKDAHLWAEAKKLCRLTDEDVRKAKKVGLGPRRLIKGSKDQLYKTQTRDWIREMYDAQMRLERFQKRQAKRKQ